MQFELMKSQEKVNELRQEVASMNKECEYWQQVRIDATIAAMQGMLANPAHQKVQSESGEPFGYFYAMNAIMCANVLVEELKRSDDVYAECRRMDAINTASVCENMTKIQKELQKKGGQDEDN